MTESGLNLWILTEERPKPDALELILARFARDHKLATFINTIRILPVLSDNKFTFTYEVDGFRCNKVSKVYVKIVSGNSSFVDYLVFYQKNQPVQSDTPLYAIEETKTDDSESRNTGVYQRASKFVFIDYYYPKIKKVMLYNLSISQKITPTRTNIFGTRLLLTLGVLIQGRKYDNNIFKPFTSVDEIVEYKNTMRAAPAGNVPIIIKKYKDCITVSGRLYKSGSLSHDPNIGALSLICCAIRKLGWRHKICIIEHGLNQKHVLANNKFIKIANYLSLSINNLNLGKNNNNEYYWKYEIDGEKIGTIFIHTATESFANGFSIFENHAGCEKGYFITKDGQHIQLEKYSDRVAYKKGNKKKIISIPDIILLDISRKVVINVEGKKYIFRKLGIKELKGFKDIEKAYINKYYPEYRIIRTVVLYGGHEDKVIEIKVGFLLNDCGDLILGVKAPELFRDAINNLLDFWS